jgi:hypothetical protein
VRRREVTGASLLHGEHVLIGKLKKPQKRENPAGHRVPEEMNVDRVARRAAGVAAGYNQRSEGGGVTV